VNKGKPLKSEWAISSWRQWPGNLSVKPEITAQLDGGLSNQSFLLVSGDKRMVLRLNNNDTALPGASRVSEASIWKAASDAGIAPPLLYADEHDRFLVSQYVEGDLPSLPQTDRTLLDQVFKLIRKCHSLEVNAATLDYEQHIGNYWRLINNTKTVSKSLLRQREVMQQLLCSLLETEPQRGLCHHDLVKANFVGYPKRLYLIDWEYAARGLVVMDYAALSIEWGISDEVVLGYADIEAESLGMAKRLYGYLCALWGALPA